ncbi:hypothetical protein T01_169 [Trichinella spiralis]|uniref:Uncharacterized protein n=1 Tax=Trichinella spiralis TaxID=6334 RepID=A0A0V1BD88_TRISP|nr:hypothetical protein T01_169 [Trichinella spiralis]
MPCIVVLRRCLPQGRKMLAHHQVRLTETGLENLHGLRVVRFRERDSFNGAPRPSLPARYHVSKLCGDIQVAAVIDACFKLGPDGGEF